VGFTDGLVQGLTGIDIVGDDYYETNLGKGVNKNVSKFAPVAAGLATGIATGNPQAGMAVYQGTKSLGNEAHAEPEGPIDPYNGINPAVAEDGMPTGDIPKMFNIEKGELIVDPATGDIVEDLDSFKYKPHSKNKKNEHQGNFIELPEGLTIIPKKDADRFRKNPNLRKGIIRNVENLFKERMAFGKDSNGNIQEYNKVLKAQDGVMTNGSPLRLNDPNFMPFNHPYAQDPLTLSMSGSNGMIQGNPNLMPPSMSNQLPSAYASDYSDYTDLNTDIQPLGSAKPTITPNFDILKPDPKVMATGNPNLKYNPKGIPSTGSFGGGNDSENLMTPGNYVGLTGALIGGLGPLAVTKKVGIDKDEFNTFGNVSNRAANALSSVLGKSREEAMRTLRSNTNMATNINRNASSNFSTMSARNQSAVNNLNQNVGRTALQYDVPLAQGLSSIYGNADMAYAGADERRLERLDQNRDNYYSNLSSNLTNLGQLTQHTGREMNRTKENQIKLNTLQSSDFKANPDGTYSHKGDTYIFDSKTNSFIKK